MSCKKMNGLEYKVVLFCVEELPPRKKKCLVHHCSPTDLILEYHMTGGRQQKPNRSDQVKGGVDLVANCQVRSKVVYCETDTTERRTKDKSINWRMFLVGVDHEKRTIDGGGPVKRSGLHKDNQV